MPRRRTIPADPSPGKNYFLLDANVLVYKALPRGLRSVNIPNKDASRVRRCLQWLEKIEKQVREGKARVYVPDVTIAEAFKVLAKWYYKDGWLTSPVMLDQARKRLRKFVSSSHREMARMSRVVGVHDEPVNRDVIIGVDRFLEPMFRNKLNVQIGDLLLLSIAKYLMDFYDIPKEQLFIITADKALLKLTRKLTDLPTAIDPTDYPPGKAFV